MQNIPYHQETIKYNLGLLWAMLLATIVGTLATAGYAFYAGSSGWFAPLFMTAMVCAIAVYFARTELRIELREDSFLIHYIPWRRYEYFREDIESITLEEYEPGQYDDFNWLRDRMRIMGNQYNLHLKLKDGRSFYVSTQNPREAREALSRWHDYEETDLSTAEKLELDPLALNTLLREEDRLIR